MGNIFAAIIIGGIIGLCFFYSVRNCIQNNENERFDKKVVKIFLAIPQLHIMYACLIYGYICFITPGLMPEDQAVRSFFQEHEVVGGIVGGLTGVDLNPDIAAAYDKVQAGKTYGLIFMIALIILSLVEGVGLINRKLDRWIIEGAAILASIGSYFSFQYAVDLQKEIMNNSTILQLADVAASILGVGGFSTMFNGIFNFTFWIMLFGLLINHFLYHRALNKYYDSNR